MTDQIERINPLKKSKTVSTGETATSETALSSFEVSGLNLVSVHVGELDGRDIEAMADLNHRIVVPISK